MKKLLVTIMLIIYGFSIAQDKVAIDPVQAYTTGNLVNNTTSPTNTTGTWQNVGSWNQGLPCWSPQDSMYGAYCGPNPYFNNGSFNFSYGVTDVHQYVSIANALPNSGTGLRVNGYNFGFMAKNGNGWDGAGLDTLSAYVTFYGSDGKAVRNDYYNLNYNFDWTVFNFSKTFDTPYATKDLSTVRYGFVGGDTSNYWAGPYGPEITNIGFTLQYSVDPCYNNVLSSPTCPGYFEALNKLIPTPNIESNPITSTSTSPTTTTTVTVEPTSVVTTSTSTIAQPSVVAPVVSNTATTTSSTTSNKESTSTNTSLALSIISKNQERDSAALSVAQTAVSQTNQVAQQSQQEASDIANSAVANSQTVNVVNVNGQQSNGNGLRIGSMSVNSNSISSNIVTTLGTNSASMQNPQNQTSTLNISTSNQTVIEQPQQTQNFVLPNTSLAAATVQNYSIIPPNFLTDRTNPLTEIVEGRQVTAPSSANTITGPSVNREVGDNDVAGGVSINRMASAPTGYNNYLNFTLRDVAFYEPKEVYRNQKNVDNARALRQLTNDSKHRDMVEQQYRR